MKIKCSQCGVSLDVLEDEYFIDCPYCNTSLYLISHQSFPHYIVPASLEDKHIRQIIRDFNIRFNFKADIKKYDSELFYFPFWKIEFTDPSQHFLTIQPAMESPFEWLNSFSLPGADLKFYSERYLNKNDRVVEPSKSYLELLNESESFMGEINKREIKGSLIHYPFIRANFTFEQRDFSLWIDAAHRQLIAFEPELPPPSLKRNFSRKLFIYSAAFFMLEGIIIPGGWKIPAFALSFFLLYRWALAKIKRI